LKFREFGNTGVKISEISLGTWQLGGTWGAEYDEKTALATLEAAYEQGINFFDTADVYNASSTGRGWPLTRVRPFQGLITSWGLKRSAG
jgi:aryl-alcohol dehydrogenase-like predicted oxidoreductase